MGLVKKIIRHVNLVNTGLVKNYQQFSEISDTSHISMFKYHKLPPITKTGKRKHGCHKLNVSDSVSDV